MLPYKSLIALKKNSHTAVYIQIANNVSREISNGIIKPNTKLPGTRVLGNLLNVHRNTVVAAYEELAMQGWIHLVPKKGAFVSARIPDIKPRTILQKGRTIIPPQETGFEIVPKISIEIPATSFSKMLEFNDGLPDERLAPVEELNKAYRSLFKRSFKRSSHGYSSVAGNILLREQISRYVNETRGLQTTADNIFITKGSQMGIFLSAQIILRKGDRIVVGETNYHAADSVFEYAGAILERIPLDDRGLEVDLIERLCKQKKIRAVYITPHHHFPTTVTMSACRRMALMALAEKYGFAILEDDYDYDFHYKSSPILPLASTDSHGMVIYIGSLSKNFSPGLRVAYLVAPHNMIHELSKLRFLIDRQGDPLLEQAIALLFNEGVMKRHLKKSLMVYKERRDLLCTLLSGKLKDKVNFKIPDGGLAVWAEFDRKMKLSVVAEKARKSGLIISNGTLYNYANKNINGIRLGFASLTSSEMERAVNILQRSV